MVAPVGVHHVGSLPLADAEQVFRQIPAALPDRLYSIPDGEPDARGNYIYWELSCFPKEARRPWLPDTTDVPEDHPGFTQDSVVPSYFVCRLAPDNHAGRIRPRRHKVHKFRPARVRVHFFCFTSHSGLDYVLPSSKNCLSYSVLPNADLADSNSYSKDNMQG
ncbi:hypothetical protein N8T08_009813 [Aspergillus melleus]|uniref:Uncharacterized protein n=1 Tax=Aspergillus melleus TaxID=138277 RepID=A0ACC3ASZ1_9EURO|nr:hypothetical protein N8T08_009813 [Aspergillus melleus]